MTQSYLSESSTPFLLFSFIPICVSTSFRFTTHFRYQPPLNIELTEKPDGGCACHRLTRTSSSSSSPISTQSRAPRSDADPASYHCQSMIANDKLRRKNSDLRDGTAHISGLLPSTDPDWHRVLYEYMCALGNRVATVQISIHHLESSVLYSRTHSIKYARGPYWNVGLPIPDSSSPSLLVLAERVIRSPTPVSCNCDSRTSCELRI